MNRTILVAEDEFRMRKLIAAYFKKEGFHVVEAGDGQACMDEFERNKIDLVILDIMMPGMDGWTVCRAIRDRSWVPVVMLTARSAEEDKLLGFELGADEYVTKPFSPKVLVARVKALFKRIGIYEGLQDAGIEIGGLCINQASHEVTIEDRQVNLSPKEYDILLFLAINKNIVFSREKLLDRIWGYDYEGDWRTVDTHIKRLREKLGDKASLITTIRGTGYKLEG